MSRWFLIVFGWLVGLQLVSGWPVDCFLVGLRFAFGCLLVLFWLFLGCILVVYWLVSGWFPVGFWLAVWLVSCLCLAGCLLDF